MTISENVKQKVLGTWLEPIREWGIEEVLDRTLDAVIREYRRTTVFPAKSKIFRAFTECPYEDVSVIWVGQDPYHDGSATGLCFANEKEEDKWNFSLKAIHREWEENVNDGSFDPSLRKYASQGVLLLNQALTVQEGEPKSHNDIWHNWTATFVAHLSKHKGDLLWVMFGKEAQNWKNHIVHGHALNVVHPAAESYSNGNSGFYGSRFFNRINDQLEAIDKPLIIW